MTPFFKRLSRCVFVISLPLSLQVLAESKSVLEPKASAGLGAFFHAASMKARAASLFEFSFTLGCHSGSFCQRFRPNFFKTDFQLALNDDVFVSQYVPYLQGNLRLLQVAYLPWLKFGAGVLNVGRNPQFLNTNVSFTAQLFELEMVHERPIRDGNYRLILTTQALGAKYVQHFTNSVPYQGLALIGILPEFQVLLKKSRVTWDLGVRLGLQTSVGQSGDGGIIDQRGPFRSLLLEPLTDIKTRLQIPLLADPHSTLAFYTQLGFRYQVLLDLGPQNLDMGFFASLTVGLVLP